MQLFHQKQHPCQSLQPLLHAGGGGARIDRGGAGLRKGAEYTSGRRLHEGPPKRETPAQTLSFEGGAASVEDTLLHQ